MNVFFQDSQLQKYKMALKPHCLGRVTICPLSNLDLDNFIA